MINRNTHRRARIKEHIAKKIRGTAERPRLTVYHSLRHVYAQIVDDTTAKVITATSTVSKDLRSDLKDMKDRKEIAKKIGMALAKKALAQKINTVVFDRNGYQYHGVVKALAEGAREGGLKF
ncbi:MAG TPA: 50S ribosomal protein L18 [Bacteroidota bacterium]|nr:50S ribosomal protein L18 [Bacteroidota bacterium]